jgi:RadC-like JAB domain
VTKAAWYDGEREVAVVLCLNTKLAITAFALVGIGTLNEVTLHPRDVFRPAIAAGAARIVFMHNHPSGDPWPSLSDARMTGWLAQCGRMLGISLLDSVIVGKEKHFSFRDATASELVEFSPEQLAATVAAWNKRREDAKAKRRTRRSSMIALPPGTGGASICNMMRNGHPSKKSKPTVLNAQPATAAERKARVAELVATGKVSAKVAAMIDFREPSAAVLAHARSMSARARKALSRNARATA